MTRYKEQQTGWLVIVPATLMFFLLTLLYTFQLGDRPISTGPYLVAIGVLVLMVALMYRMQTEVTEASVSVRFGVGLIKRVIPVASIQSVKVVTNAWYYGWGIRYIPGGMLYNISGTKGIELQLKGGRRVRIGSTNPEGLAREVELNLGK
ncbi:MAG: hypothetical protein JNN04_15235 [Cyclobacteriaceae bacterium]|nr:hypothetical protein [Cyclobacteriaceae bacterium]